MWNVTRKLQHAVRFSRKSSFFGITTSAQNTPFLFPLRSRVIGDCTIPFSLTNNLIKNSHLKESIISLETLNNSYGLTPRAFSAIGLKIKDLATIMDSVNISFLKLAGLLSIKYLMEMSHKIFLWTDYYAIAEYTAINLLNYGYTDKAIQLIERMPAVLYYSNCFDTSRVHPFYRSTRDLLVLAYLIKGDLAQAAKSADIYLATTKTESVFTDYQASALTIKSLIHFIKGEYNQCIVAQEEAIKLLSSSSKTSFKALALYDLWVFHCLQNNENKANEILNMLNQAIHQSTDPLDHHIKLFIQKQIDNVHHTSYVNYKY